ncbi:MAG: SseB family protein [Clostridia bacterium]|nr:SseB family protein [Clostridia bacterium]
MGLFEKRSKKAKNNVDELAEKADKLIDSESKTKEAEKTKKPEKKAESSVLKAEEKRFTLVVENAYNAKDGKGVIIGGNLHGKLKKNDKVFVIHPVLKDMLEVTVDELEDAPMSLVDEAENTRVGIKFASIDDRNKIPKFSVVTNIQPHAKPSANNPVDNPYLLGLTREYTNLIKDKAFEQTFTFAVFSSGYVTPVKVDMDPEKTTDNKAVLKKGTKVSFKLLHHPNDDNILALPIFTDYIELKKWQNAYSDSETPQNFFMSFEQCADIGLKNGGMVINPFGSSPVFVPKEVITQTLKVKADLDKRIAEETAAKN